MSRARTAVARLGRRLVERSGDTATYVRDAGQVTPKTGNVSIVEGRERDVTRDGARAAAWQAVGWDRDVLIPVADLAAADFAEPLNGDRIVVTVEGKTETLEAFPPEGERAWRYTDGTRSIYRIHCRLVANA